MRPRAKHSRTQLSHTPSYKSVQYRGTAWGGGLVRTRNRVIKQDGTPVVTYIPLRMIKYRDGGGDA